MMPSTFASLFRVMWSHPPTQGFGTAVSISHSYLSVMKSFTSEKEKSKTKN